MKLNDSKIKNTNRKKIELVLLAVSLIAMASFMFDMQPAGGTVMGMPEVTADVNVIHNVTTSVGSLYSYIIGNTTATDGFPAYEGPGSAQNQKMPQYLIIAVNPVGNTSAAIVMDNKTLYSGSADSSSGPFLYTVYTNLTGDQTVTITMHSYFLNQTVTDTYSISLELVSSFIHYEQSIHPATQPVIISSAALTVSGILGILAVPMGFISRSGIMIIRFKRWFIDRWGN